MPKRPPRSSAPWSWHQRADRLGADVLVLGVQAYRLLVRPVLPPACRFAPSCSAFALEALRAHGAWRGGRLAIRRLSRCHPWNPGGYDPVPSRRG